MVGIAPKWIGANTVATVGRAMWKKRSILCLSLRVCCESTVPAVNLPGPAPHRTARTPRVST
jgi:hypothetical protein